MKIERVTPQDAAELLDIYAPYVRDTAISFEYEVPSPAEFCRRIENTIARFPYIKAVEDGVIYGYAYVGTFHARKAYDWSVETSIYVRKDARGRGIGRLLHDALEDTLADMGILNMYACIASPPTAEDEHLTDASERFHARIGYRMVGCFEQCGYKFDRWYNMVWMEKMIGDHAGIARPVRFGSWEIPEKYTQEK